jgi:DNA-binding response OmpR family regulator
LSLRIGTVARILILEPHPEVRHLLVLVARRLGHEAVPGDENVDFSTFDACVLEPAVPGGLDLVRALHAAGVAAVCVSIFPRSHELRALEPAAYLQKPFALTELEQALADAVRHSERPLAAATAVAE